MVNCLFFGGWVPPRGTPPLTPLGVPKNPAWDNTEPVIGVPGENGLGPPFWGVPPIFDCWTPKTHDHGLYKAYLPCLFFIFKMCCSHIAKFVVFLQILVLEKSCGQLFTFWWKVCRTKRVFASAEALTKWRTQMYTKCTFCVHILSCFRSPKVSENCVCWYIFSRQEPQNSKFAIFLDTPP